MFKLTPKDSYTAVAQITVPGAAKPADLKVQFKHLTKEEIKAMVETLPGRSDLDVLSEVMVGWEDMDEPFSKESLAKLLNNYPASAGELFATWQKEATGSRAKN